LVRLIVISVTTGQRQRVFAFQIQHRWAPTPALEAILWPAAQPGPASPANPTVAPRPVIH
jgi:hypothetical protein